ncbi:DUF4126 domain-containing protein [Actinomadura craniellae]|nr:DUF4126 domain-containing protein [Actinomadura craniellae]
MLTGLGLSAAAGLNAYIPLLVVGLLDRQTDLVRLPAEFGWLTDARVLAVLGVLLVAEMTLDKIAVVDHLNDAVQTFVRPAAGGAVFAATDSAARLDTFLAQDHPWLGWVLGVATALVVHLVKVTARPVVNLGTAGTGTPVVSAAEDGLSLGMSLLAVLAPVVALILLLAAGWAGWRLVRRARRRRRTADPVSPAGRRPRRAGRTAGASRRRRSPARGG